MKTPALPIGPAMTASQRLGPIVAAHKAKAVDADPKPLIAALKAIGIVAKYMTIKRSGDYWFAHLDKQDLPPFFCDEASVPGFLAALITARRNHEAKANEVSEAEAKRQATHKRWHAEQRAKRIKATKEAQP